MESIQQPNVSTRLLTSVTSVVDDAAVHAVVFSPPQEQPERSDEPSRLVSEPAQRSPSPASSDSAPSNDDFPPSLSGDLPAALSSIISSHEASFYGSLMLNRATNLDELEGCTNHTERGCIETATGAAAEKYAYEQRPPVEAHLSTPRHTLAQSSVDWTGDEKEVVLGAVAETASSSATAKTAESEVVATRLYSVGVEETSCSGRQPQTHHCRLASQAGDVKTLTELLDWRTHLSAWQQSLDAHEDHNTDDDGALKDTCSDQAGHVYPVGPMSRERAPASTRPTIKVAEVLEGSQAPPRGASLQCCHVGLHGTPATSSSPSTPAITPAESNAAGGGSMVVAQHHRSRQSHASSDAASQTELTDAFFATKISLNASPLQPRSPAQMEEGHPRHAQPHAHLVPHFFSYENPVTRVPPIPHATITDARVVRDGGRTSKSGRPSGAGSPTSPSSWRLEGTEVEGHTSPGSTQHRSPFSHSPFLHGLERRSWARSSLPPPANNPVLLYSTPPGGFDGYRARDSWNSPRPGNGKIAISSIGIPRQLSRDVSSSQATPRTPEPWRHKTKAMLPTGKPGKDLIAEDEYPVFAVPVDEETNKAVVAFVSGVILLICLVFIFAM
ncbi:hypothetical protein, conserved [Leishmania lindenbergi]|uniref:Uncharacterized protein n=1 Tax=Leishmania lindenbergi TaxID=651832 RepID=A0AAW3A1P1_9TRYP